MSLYRRYFAATSNADFGYFGGGFDPSARSTVDRIDYNNDTATAVAKGPLTLARYHLAATGNADFGYFGGGKTPSSPALSTVDRIDYTNDTATASPKGPLSSARAYIAAVGNLNFGYFGGGSVVSTVDRIDYTNDTATASPKGPLSLARKELGATSARANGFVPIGPSVVSNAAAMTASPNPTKVGYFIGGHNPTFTTIERIDYTNDTVAASVRGPLNFAIQGGSATGNSFFGYYSSGNRQGPSAPYGPFSMVQRINYTNDTATAVTVGPLSNESYGGAGATGTADFGYFGGGYVAGPTYYTTVNRIDYSNDTATAAVKGPLSAARGYVSATGNKSFGYFGGGHWPGLSTVDRIDYSNDTVTASPKGPLSQAREGTASTGNADFGYFGGGMGSTVPGSNISSRVDRIDYSNDTATAAVKGPLTGVKRKAAATGNINFGYFGGGETPANPNYTDICRIDYSNDTATALKKGTLFDGRGALGACSGAANALPQ